MIGWAKRWQSRPNLAYLRSLTTPLGLVQHAQGNTKNFEHGYSIDDNARALIICLWYEQLFNQSETTDLIQIYFRYLIDAALPGGQRHNFRGVDGVFSDLVGSEDAIGRTIWALGTAVARWKGKQKQLAQEQFKMSIQAVKNFQSPRAVAFSLLGLIAVKNQALSHNLIKRLIIYYQLNSSPDWKWFEPILSYSNAILPYSLLKTNRPDAVVAGLESLDFLNRVFRIDQKPAPIGNRGWYSRTGERAIFDQQAIDAADMVLANLAAYRKTGKRNYRKEAENWFGWFWGNNILSRVLVTSEGGCYDGLTPEGVNTNQGAESVVAYLLAHLALIQEDKSNDFDV